MPLKIPERSSNIPTTANIKIRPATQTVMSTESLVTTIKVRRKVNGSNVDTVIWEKAQAPLNIRVKSIDYTDYDEESRLHVWTGNNCKKFISNIKVTIKDLDNNETVLFNLNSSDFTGNSVDLSSVSKYVVPGVHSIKVSVTCKDWCCVDEMRISTSSNPANTSGIQLIKRERQLNNDDATTNTSTGYFKISNSTFTSSSKIYLWITLSAFHLASQVDISTSRVYLLDDRYSDYFSIGSQFTMKAAVICKTDRTKIYRQFTVTQATRGSQSRQFVDEQSDGYYFAYDSGSQIGTPILDVNLPYPMFYTLKCAPKDNFVNWAAPNVISISGCFTGNDLTNYKLGEYH